MAPRYVKLGEIADVLNGMSDTKQSEPDHKAGVISYRFLQPNHLGLFNDIHGASEIKRSSPIGDAYMIQKDDILLKRLNPDIATLITEDILNTTFSGNLFVIRVNKAYSPAYVACLLENQRMFCLGSNIVGSVTAIKSVSTKSLVSLEIPVIEYERQKKVGQMWLLYKKRKQLLNHFISEDQRLMSAIINKVTTDVKEEE